MRELALHLLDLAENSIRAGATLIEIIVTENSQADMLTLEISDNGRGMSREMLAKATDPFFTTKDVRRTGLGIPLFSQAAKTAGGSFSITSEEGKGTKISAAFRSSHIDRQPLGDLPGALAAIIVGNPEMDIRLVCRKDSRVYAFDTKELRAELEEIPLNHTEVLNVLRNNIRQGLDELFIP